MVDNSITDASRGSLWGMTRLYWFVSMFVELVLIVPRAIAIVVRAFA